MDPVINIVNPRYSSEIEEEVRYCFGPDVAAESLKRIEETIQTTTSKKFRAALEAAKHNMTSVLDPRIMESWYTITGCSKSMSMGMIQWAEGYVNTSGQALSMEKMREYYPQYQVEAEKRRQEAAKALQEKLDAIERQKEMNRMQRLLVHEIPRS